ncbi:glycosyltransferase family 2 protein [Parvularcula dongshanensis]|uniref:GT2 family glycosyltransferase n=1 Tax=Parvularcula dongshanensis TaxID=1173995 RepID=A0A840I4K8_9PROT|nr:GT2 family glycosyltransferase [Parvularcula dongshanensis]
MQDELDRQQVRGAISCSSLSIIIINYNAGCRLKRCLAALARQSDPHFEVIVVDNASSDDSQEVVKSPFRLVRSDDNLGFAAGCNLGVRHAASEWIAFLNPDAYPDARWVAELRSGMERFPGVDAFGSTQLTAGVEDQIDGLGDAYFVAGQPFRGGFGQRRVGSFPEGEVFAPCAAAALWRRKTFVDLGGFEERFFCYGEDVDLGYRHRLAGGRCVQLRDAIVAHEGSGISGRHSAFTVYHGHRNRIWVFLRNTPLPILLVAFPAHILLNLLLVFQTARHGQGNAYLRAVRDAVRGADPFLSERRTLHADAVPWWRVARALTWSPLAVLRRSPKVWNNASVQFEQRTPARS